jgi:hypothetical protein
VPKLTTVRAQVSAADVESSDQSPDESGEAVAADDADAASEDHDTAAED